MQGIETVRRDNCLLVRNIVTTVLEMILIERDDKKAKEYVRQTIADLLMNRLDLSLLVITKVRTSLSTLLHSWIAACFSSEALSFRNKAFQG